MWYMSTGQWRKGVGMCAAGADGNGSGLFTGKRLDGAITGEHGHVTRSLEEGF